MRQNILVAVCVWGLIGLAGAAAVWKLWWQPRQEALQAKAEEMQKKEVFSRTTQDSKYKHVINVGLDQFSGYCILKSQANINHNRRSKILLNYIDIGDNVQRLRELESGNLDLATFTIDSLIKSVSVCSYQPEEIPVTIIAFIDESCGADLVVGSKTKFPTLDSISNSGTKLLAVQNTSSETLARMVAADYQISSSIDLVDSPQLLWDKYNNYFDENYVYVCRHPWGAKMLANPNMHVLTDSSKFDNCIADVIVVNRNFLYKNQDVVRSVVENYYRSVYESKDNIVALDDSLTSQIVDDICWKSTQETYAHFGVGVKAVRHIEDIISSTTKTLLNVKSIRNDPTNGHPNFLYYNGIVKDMHDSNFHPGFFPEQRGGSGPLTDEQWATLTPVSSVDIPKLVFRRGSSNLTEATKTNLGQLALIMKKFPSYYCLIAGDASLIGDMEANQILASDRAKVVCDYLFSQGINLDRMRVVADTLSGETQVWIKLGEMPY